jgi:hypothetical protein
MNEAILILAFTSTVSIITNVFQYCYKSKCEKINLCCGLINIDRDVNREDKNDQYNNTNDFEYQNIYRSKSMKRKNNNDTKIITKQPIGNKRRSQSF